MALLNFRWEFNVGKNKKFKKNYFCRGLSQYGDLHFGFGHTFGFLSGFLGTHL
jgi:hypothetical protein